MRPDALAKVMAKMENVPFILDDEPLKRPPAPSIERSISSTRKRSSASD
jgi:hypothetical protein